MRLIIFISFLSVCFPQTFSHFIEDNGADSEGEKVKQDKDGGYILLANTDDCGSELGRLKTQLIKTDSLGIAQWNICINLYELSSTYLFSMFNLYRNQFM